MLAASEFGCKSKKFHSVRTIINRQFKSRPLESRTEITLGACTLQFCQTCALKFSWWCTLDGEGGCTCSWMQIFISRKSFRHKQCQLLSSSLLCILLIPGGSFRQFFPLDSQFLSLLPSPHVECILLEIHALTDPASTCLLQKLGHLLHLWGMILLSTVSLNWTTPSFKTISGSPKPGLKRSLCKIRWCKSFFLFSFLSGSSGVGALHQTVSLLIGETTTSG